MSRRAIRRYEEALQAENATAEAETASHEDDSNSDREPVQRPTSTPPRPSLFALLGEESPESNDYTDNDEANDSLKEASTADNDDETITEQHPKKEPEERNEPINNPQPGQTKKKKRRKKRKSQKKPEEPADRENDPDWIALNESDSLTSTKIPDSFFASSDSKEVREEANRIMSMIENMVLSDENNVETSNGSCSGLSVDPRLLNADAELKKLFGSRAIEAERRDEEQTARRRGRPPARPHTRRRVSLVSPRDTWWNHAPGLTMVLDEEATKENADGIRYFRYKHEASYARIQNEYRTLVNMHDPNLLVELSSRCPYHVDTLLQLAELYRQMGELDRAAEMIERALYVLESSWSVSFKPYDGSCRLRFDILENRSLYVALFRYSQLLTRRGLHRTALEIAKLLLNFAPERDPMGMLMLADSFALLSGEYKWIKDVRRAFHSIPIEYFPNFAASEAIACESIRLGITGMSGKGRKLGKKQNESAQMTNDDVDDPDELLTDALLVFPMLLRPLLSAIQDNSGVWTEHRLFHETWYEAGYEDYGVLTRMCRVYAERSKLLWNSSNSKEMLLRCARKAGELDTAAGMGIDPVTGRSTSARVKDVKQHERVARCRAMRATAGEWLRKSGLYQHVQIADFTDSTTNLPAELLAGDGADHAVGAAVPREVSITQSAMEFLQSLLPWRDAQDAGRDEQ